MIQVFKVGIFLGAMTLSLGAADFDTGVFVENAKIKNFKLPVFADSGARKFYFYGQEGMFKDANHMLVTNMRLSVFDTSAPYSLQISIESAFANLDVKTQCVESEKALKVHSPQFDLVGGSWSWDGGKDVLLVKDHVKVLFHLDLASLLE